MSLVLALEKKKTILLMAQQRFHTQLVFKEYLESDHFPISIAAMLVSKGSAISVLDGPDCDLFTRCCCRALPPFDLF